MLVALARDGHTLVELSPSAGFIQLPVALQNFSDGYFVTAAPADHTSLNRAKLVAVGTTPIDQVLSALQPVIPHENEYYFRALAAQSLTNNISAQVLYSGPVAGVPGLWQINAQLPNDGAVTGQVPVFVSASGLMSNGVTAWVQP